VKLFQLKVNVSYFNKWQNVIYSFNGKAEFSASILQSSEIIITCSFGAQEKMSNYQC